MTALMRWVTLLLTLMLGALCSSACRAQYINVQSHLVDPMIGMFPCGGTGYTEVSFACDYEGKYYSGSAYIENGLGPYGLGGEAIAYSPNDLVFGTNAPYVISFADTSEGTDTYVSGGTGSGFIQLDLLAYLGMEGGNFDIFGMGSDALLWSFSGWTEPIPVVFDQPYPFDFYLTAKYSTYDGLYSSLDKVEILDFHAYDASGRLLPNATLDGLPSVSLVPEPSSFIFLITCTVMMASTLLFRRKSHINRVGLETHPNAPRISSFLVRSERLSTLAERYRMVRGVVRTRGNSETVLFTTNSL